METTRKDPFKPTVFTTLQWIYLQRMRIAVAFARANFLLFFTSKTILKNRKCESDSYTRMLQEIIQP